MVKRLLIIAAIIIAILVAIPVVWFVRIMIRWDRAVSSNKEFLLKQVDHRAVAAACLELLTKPEYQKLMDHETSDDDTKLPPAIQSVRAFWVSMRTNEVTIMKTGGHY
jgi:hypothetical protein